MVSYKVTHRLKLIFAEVKNINPVVERKVKVFVLYFLIYYDQRLLDNRKKLLDYFIFSEYYYLYKL